MIFIGKGGPQGAGTTKLLLQLTAKERRREVAPNPSLLRMKKFSLI